jgi:hypothetical protein
MAGIIRQKPGPYRDLVSNLHARDIERAMEQIDASGKLHQITDRKERI